MSLLVMSALLSAAPALSESNLVASGNLLPNGDLTEGNAGKPSHWRTQSFRPDPRTFLWVHPPGATGELQIVGSRADFARWSQAVSLAPGWYYLNGEMRTEDVDRNSGGTGIGVHVRGRTFSVPMKAAGSSNWAAGGLYFKVGDPGYDVEIVCMLATSPGRASFRRISLIRAAAPAPDASQVDLDAIFKRRAQKEKRAIPIPFAQPKGDSWSMPVTMLLFSALALCGWLTFRRPT